MNKDLRYNVLDYNAVGDFKTENTFPIQSTIDLCAKNGGGIVEIPSGDYLCGTIVLKDNVSLFISPGATLYFTRNEDEFRDGEEFNYNPHADMETSIFQFTLIYAEEAENISILGGGSINGNGYPRGGPKPIAIKSCERITIRDILIQSAPNYAISLIDSEYIDIENVIIRDALADGIDPDGCRNVKISNCDVSSWDDAICIKTSPSLNRLINCENVNITNCNLATACNCFKIGTETSGNVRNVTLSNCTFHPLPFAHPPTSGIAIESADGAIVENVSISNVTMHSMHCPIFIRLNKRARAQETPTPGEIKNINISNIIATNNRDPCIIHGLKEKHLEDITLNHIQLKHERQPEDFLEAYQKGFAIEDAEKAYPCPTMFPTLPSIHYFVRYVQNLNLSSNWMRAIQDDPRSNLYFKNTAGYVRNNIVDYFIKSRKKSEEDEKLPPKKDNICVIEECKDLTCFKNSW